MTNTLTVCCPACYPQAAQPAILAADIPTKHRDERYRRIYTCGHVYLRERDMHLLQARLLDPLGWPGYFAAYPQRPAYFCKKP